MGAALPDVPLPVLTKLTLAMLWCNEAMFHTIMICMEGTEAFQCTRTVEGQLLADMSDWPGLPCAVRCL